MGNSQSMYFFPNPPDFVGSYPSLPVILVVAFFLKTDVRIFPPLTASPGRGGSYIMHPFL